VAHIMSVYACLYPDDKEAETEVTEKSLFFV
jgi:hypothetical protein